MKVLNDSLNLGVIFGFYAILVTAQYTTFGYGERYNGSSEFESESSNETSLEETSAERNLSMILKMATVCETPNNDPGLCIEIRQCSTLMKQLANPEARDFLRASACGPNNENHKNPKVCCGRYENFRNISTNTAEGFKILPQKCGTQRTIMRSRIIGGKQAILGEYPWMARLIHKNKYGFRSYGCSAFLIHSKFVLTAAHCTHPNLTVIRGPVYSVILGEHNTETKIDCSPGGTLCAEPPQTSRVEKVIVHPGYDPNINAHYNDITIIYLRKGARMNDYVQPICLLTDPNEIPQKYFLSGWGRTETAQSSKIKMKIDVPSFDKTECQEKYDLLNVHLKETQICAGGQKQKDSCTGDSGGPLMMTPNSTTWFAAGIVSYGIGCGIETWPGVYTNIPSFIPWIKGQIIQNNLIATKSNFKKKHHKKNKKNKVKVNAVVP